MKQGNTTSESGVEKNRKSKNNDKEYIMHKFFQVCEKPQATQTQYLPQNLNKCYNKNEAVLESSLDKQESFFTKMLNQNIKNGPRNTRIHNPEVDVTNIRPTTPACDVITCGEDSNDTDYSGSTINNEINNSVALFEEDPQDVARVTSIRELLSSSRMIYEGSDTVSEPEHNTNAETPLTLQKDLAHIETFDCPECGKSIPINMVAEHADFHLALKLRNEERRQVRKEIQEKNVKTKQSEEIIKKKKQPEEQVSIKHETSIASFLVKINDNIPTETCSECGKKVPLEGFGEHLDFHEAQKLSRELNKKTNPSFTGSTVKRKRKSTSPVKKNKMPCRPINSFFR